MKQLRRDLKLREDKIQQMERQAQVIQEPTELSILISFFIPRAG